MPKKSFFDRGRSDEMGFSGGTSTSKTYLATYIYIIPLVVLSILFYRTRFELWLCSYDESP